MLSVLPMLKSVVFPKVSRQPLNTIQVNLGYRCNQQCVHCHVNAGPNRTECMDEETLSLIPQVLSHNNLTMLDITGGAPELNPGFRWLVEESRKLGVKVMDRCNLTVLFEPGQEETAAFLAEQQVEIIASLPCYSTENVDKQRGKGTFEKSIAALKLLNGLGYGHEGSGLMLNLVYNPVGAFLPPSQQSLEDKYQQALFDQFGIVFNQLFTLANMPIQRFGSFLLSKGLFNQYMQLLQDNFSQDNLDKVMCRSLVSVDWQGWLYDCDFNQQLDMPLLDLQKNKLHLRDLLSIDLVDYPVRVCGHCYGCTAGQGSSCGGAL